MDTKNQTPNLKKDLILRERLALQRTVLANQTTFLAFMRTAMYFLVAGLSARNFLDGSEAEKLGLLLYLFAGFILILGGLNYFKHKSLIKHCHIHIGDYKLDYLKKD